MSSELNCCFSVNAALAAVGPFPSLCLNLGCFERALFPNAVSARAGKGAGRSFGTSPVLLGDQGCRTQQPRGLFIVPSDAVNWGGAEVLVMATCTKLADRPAEGLDNILGPWGVPCASFWAGWPNRISVPGN